VHKDKYTVRIMGRREVNIAVDWATREGWNPGLNDAECFYAADQEGFLIGLVNDVPVASISAVKYGRSFGFLGFYIVSPEHRGKGYGYAIWQEGIKSLGERNIGLDGVLSAQENYKKSGFGLAYRNIRFKGISRRKTKTWRDLMNVAYLDFNELVKYDRRFFPEKRDDFLHCWIRQPQNIALGKIVNGRIAGYGVIRRCHRGCKIGPLFADDAGIAEELMLALLNSTDDNQEFYLDVPEINSEAVKLAQKYEMEMVFETVRMYTREAPKIEVNGVFGVTTFELG